MSIFLTHIKLFANEGNIYDERLKVINFAAEHFLPAINSYFWHLTLELNKGEPVDPFEYALARNYFGQDNFIYRKHFILPNFRFVSDDEFKVINIEPDRLAIRTSDGSIIWNAEKLHSMPDFTVFDAIKFLLHEFNHSFDYVVLRNKDITYTEPLSLRGTSPEKLSETEKTLLAQKYFVRDFNYYYRHHKNFIAPIELSQKDRFVSNFIAFLKNRTMVAQNSARTKQFSIMNLMLNFNRKEQSIIFGSMSGSPWNYEQALIGWSSGKDQPFRDETQNLSILYSTYGRTKLAKKPVAEEVGTVRNQLQILGVRGKSADFLPDIQIHSISLDSSDQVKIEYEMHYQPTFKNSGGLRSFQHLDRQPFEDLSSHRQLAKAILNSDTSLTSNDDILKNSSLSLNYRSYIPLSKFDLVKTVDKNNERFLTFDIKGFDQNVDLFKSPILVCLDENKKKYTISSHQLIKRGKDLRVIFKTQFLGELNIVEIVWPGYISNSKNQYVEKVIRAKSILKVNPNNNWVTRDNLSSDHFKIDQAEFNLNGQLILKISGQKMALTQIDSILAELGHFRKHVVLSMKVEGEHPFWTLQVGEKIFIPTNKIKKFTKSFGESSIEFAIPILQLSKLQHNSEIREAEKFQLADADERVLSGLWLKTKDGGLIQVELEQEAIFSKESAYLLKQLEKPQKINGFKKSKINKCNNLFK